MSHLPIPMLFGSPPEEAPPPTLAAAVPRPEDLPFSEGELLLCALVVLFASSFFAFLRAGLLRSVTSRVLGAASSDRQRERLRPRLARAESLATSAYLVQLTFQILLVLLVYWLFAEHMSDPAALGCALLVGVPLLGFSGSLLPNALSGPLSDRMLLNVLPAFDLAQRPLGALIIAMEALQRSILRLLRVPERPRSARQIVEDIRTVVEDSDRDQALEDVEREIIENVVDFHDVDVAEVMTPRTELHAMEVHSPAMEGVRLIAETGRARFPVFEQTVDTIVGVVFARDLLSLVATSKADEATLRDVMRPVPFVPETKLVSELLAELREKRHKMAVVLDEYGGTAGIVTLGDIIEELVGDMPEELGEETPEEIQPLAEGGHAVLGTTHVSDVNEELGLDLPEEQDYETLAGFVLAQLGHFPEEGEFFCHAGIEYRVAQANDRRVLAVHIKKIDEARSLRA